MLVTSVTSTSPPTPHDIPNSWRRRDDRGGGVMTEPDGLVALQALRPELVQQVELSLLNIQQRQNIVKIAIIAVHCFLLQSHISSSAVLNPKSMLNT